MAAPVLGQKGGVKITFDAPIVALFRPGMIVTATYQELRDASGGSRWELSTPGYVWPSWYCQKGCLDKEKAPPPPPPEEA
jgi:hypothetical protein